MREFLCHSPWEWAAYHTRDVVCMVNGMVVIGDVDGVVCTDSFHSCIPSCWNNWNSCLVGDHGN